jgi:hypothetical protein
VPFGNDVVVTDAAAAITIVKAGEDAMAFFASVTVNTYGPNVPEAVGVPVIAPVLGVSIRPPGNAPPEVCAQV